MWLNGQFHSLINLIGGQSQNDLANPYRTALNLLKLNNNSGGRGGANIAKSGIAFYSHHIVTKISSFDQNLDLLPKLLWAKISIFENFDIWKFSDFRRKFRFLTKKFYFLTNFDFWAKTTFQNLRNYQNFRNGPSFAIPPLISLRNLCPYKAYKNGFIQAEVSRIQVDHRCKGIRFSLFTLSGLIYYSLGVPFELISRTIWV